MITLRWAPFPGASVASYKVYRSMIGFRAPALTPSVVSGKTLILKVNNNYTQTIQFDGTTILVDKINKTIQGARAYDSVSDPNYFLLRSDIRVSPGYVQIVGGTSLSDLGLTARLITERSEDDMLAQIPANPDPDVVMTYEDPDGVCQDWYTVTTIDLQGAESPKAPYRQPVTYTGEVCVLEGIVTDLQGVRIPDVEVKASIITRYPQRDWACPQITLDPITTRTSSDGRFSLPLLQGALVEFTIDAVGFNRNITVPNKPYEFITDLQVDLDYRYPLEYRE